MRRIKTEKSVKIVISIPELLKKFISEIWLCRCIVHGYIIKHCSKTYIYKFFSDSSMVLVNPTQYSYILTKWCSSLSFGIYFLSNERKLKS